MIRLGPLVTATFATVFISWSGSAQNAAPLPVQKAVEPKCESRMKADLVAPLEAKALPGTGRHGADRGGGEYVYNVCFQVRTKGGGFAKEFGSCLYKVDGSVVRTEIGDLPDYVVEGLCKPR